MTTTELDEASFDLDGGLGSHSTRSEDARLRTVLASFHHHSPAPAEESYLRCLWQVHRANAQGFGRGCPEAWPLTDPVRTTLSSQTVENLVCEEAPGGGVSELVGVKRLLGARAACANRRISGHDVRGRVVLRGVGMIWIRSSTSEIHRPDDLSVHLVLGILEELAQGDVGIAVAVVGHLGGA